MKVVSLFAGAGGLDLGLVQAGNKIIWANDNDVDCVNTYAKNIGTHIRHADIETVKSDDIPNADVVVGGFPCQGFSLANKHRSSEDQRNKLYLEFKRVVGAKKPKYFLAENVRGILSLDGGKAIEKILSDFEDAGYRVQYRLFNVADYGVPQSRFRVIIAGTRNDMPKELDFVYPEPTHSKNNVEEKLSWVTIGDALSDIPEPSEDSSLHNHVYSRYKVTNRNFTGHRRTNPDKPSPTILARGNGKGGVCAIQHPLNHRRMSVRESAIIQSFPKNFVFTGSLTSMYRQVGNAVPVLFGRRLGEQLKKLELEFA